MKTVKIEFVHLIDSRSSAWCGLSWGKMRFSVSDLEYLNSLARIRLPPAIWCRKCKENYESNYQPKKISTNAAQ